MSTTVTAATFIKGSTGNGATLSIGGATVAGTPSTAFTGVGGITDITGAGLKLGTVATTDLTSRLVRRIGTTIDGQTYTFTVKNAMSDAGQTACTAALMAAVPFDFQVVYTDLTASMTVTVAFSALVTSAGAIDLEDDKVNTSKIELTLDGVPTVTTVPIVPIA